MELSRTNRTAQLDRTASESVRQARPRRTTLECPFVPKERSCRRVLHQDLTETVHHEGGRLAQPVHEPHQPWSDVCIGQSPGPRVVTGEPEEVIALVDREPRYARGCRPLRRAR